MAVEKHGHIADGEGPGQRGTRQEFGELFAGRRCGVATDERCFQSQSKGGRDAGGFRAARNIRRRGPRRACRLRRENDDCDKHTSNSQQLRGEENGARSCKKIPAVANKVRTETKRRCKRSFARKHHHRAENGIPARTKKVTWPCMGAPASNAQRFYKNADGEDHFSNKQFTGALGGFHYGFDQRYAQLALFEFENSVDGAAGGGGDGVFQ